MMNTVTLAIIMYVNSYLTVDDLFFITKEDISMVKCNVLTGFMYFHNLENLSEDFKFGYEPSDLEKMLYCGLK